MGMRAVGESPSPGGETNLGEISRKPGKRPVGRRQLGWMVASQERQKGGCGSEHEPLQDERRVTDNMLEGLALGRRLRMGLGNTGS